MIKALIVIAVLIALIGYALCVASSTSGRDTHKAYERWKERQRNE